MKSGLNSVEKKVPSEKPRTVWIVDDEPLVVQSLMLELEEIPELSLRGFTTLEPLKEAFTNQSAPPSVVLLDIKMPECNGTQLIRPLKEAFPETKVLMHTVVNDATTMREAMHLGADGYLVKGYSLDQLLAAIRSAQEGFQPIDAKLTNELFGLFEERERKLVAYDLSAAEVHVLQLSLKGHTVAKISRTLFKSEDTIRTHRKNIYSKLSVHSMGELTAKLIADGTYKLVLKIT
jgi:DNA-binding NarL/FixJ family response regulator